MEDARHPLPSPRLQRGGGGGGAGRRRVFGHTHSHMAGSARVQHAPHTLTKGGMTILLHLPSVCGACGTNMVLGAVHVYFRWAYYDNSLHTTVRDLHSYKKA